MSAAQGLTLDTTAPVITWGTVTGARPGQTLEVSYTRNEPEVVTAELLAGAVATPLTVGPAALTGLVPAGSGAATVRALVRDAVGNQTVRELPVTLKQTTFGPGMPGRVDHGSPGHTAQGGTGHVGEGSAGRVDRGDQGRVG